MPGIYVHIPFCKKKCKYCDFNSVARAEHLLPEYLNALLSEIAARADFTAWGVFDTVFIGGGTPSLLSGDQVNMLLSSLYSAFLISPGAEVTLECNPGTLDLDKLTAYRQSGVNRLSLGVQSMDDNLLAHIGRLHSRTQAKEALIAAADAGFTNINVDLMHGLPGQTELDYLSTLQDIAKLAPTHISAYSLILEEHTQLYEAVNAKRLTLPTEDERDIMQEVGYALLNTHGYIRYEISNFSKPGCRCAHNMNYWNNGPYLGLGFGAHSAWRLGGQWSRWENGGSLDAYIKEGPQALSHERLSRIPYKEEAFETLMMGLRLSEGISLDAFAARFGVAIEDMHPKAIQALEELEWLVIEDGYMRLTERGLDMQNAALRHFMD